MTLAELAAKAKAIAAPPVPIKIVPFGHTDVEDSELVIHRAPDKSAPVVTPPPWGKGPHTFYLVKRASPPGEPAAAAGGWERYSIDGLKKCFPEFQNIDTLDKAILDKKVKVDHHPSMTTEEGK